MKKDRLLLHILLLLLLLLPLSAQERLILGNEDQWQGAYTLGLQPVEGRQGFLDLGLAHNQRISNEDSQWLITFDGALAENPTGFYRIVQAPEIQQRFTQRGTGAAWFSGEEGIVLEPQPGALFYPYSQWGDFSMEFWLYPANLEEGENLMQWKGFIRNNNQILPQEWVCRIVGRKIQWEFLNFFLSPERTPSQFKLEGDPLIPRKWSHHLLRYRHDLGLLEYLIDGSPVAMVHTTASGLESYPVFHPLIEQNQATPIILGGDFHGIMDEFYFTQNWEGKPSLLEYERPGYYISPIIDMEYQDSLVEKILVEHSQPGQSRIRYYYNLTNEKDQAQLERSRMTNRQRPEQGLEQWTPLDPSSPEIYQRGRYLTLAAVLYPDVGEEETPSLSSLEVRYSKHLPPVPPLNLQAFNDQGNIHLRWDYSDNSEIAGFYIYYGTRPGQYFGEGSPIRVDGPTNQYVIEGLDRYQTWYISMVAFNQSEPPQYSDFSEEVAVQP